jgi:putative ABC transport system substrate-binding protein
LLKGDKKDLVARPVVPVRVHCWHETVSAMSVAELAVTHRLRFVSPNSLFTDAGSLMSYGATVNKLLRRMAYCVRKILDGANSGNLPIEQPIELELFVNLKTTKTLGIEIPPTLLARAGEVIE